MNHLKEKEIWSAIYYPKPLHLHPHFEKMGFKKWDFPIAEKVADEVVSLPVHPSITDEEISFIINTLKKYV
jgi:dTDP-4-amino-4,6-dideoxygalactose transaminase